ncbi:MAG TPA: hypothetical protein VIC87_16895 [Vicinamibacteria bacterium]
MRPLLLVALLEPLAAASLPFPMETGRFWEYRESYTERREGLDVTTDDVTRFQITGSASRPFLSQRGGADPSSAPIEWGDDWLRLGAWTGEEPLPLPLAVGRSGPPAEGRRPGWTVEAEEEVRVPAGEFRALRCALRTWRSESILWVAQGIGVVKEVQGTPGSRPEIERVLVRYGP